MTILIMTYSKLAVLNKAILDTFLSLKKVKIDSKKQILIYLRKAVANRAIHSKSKKKGI